MSNIGQFEDSNSRSKKGKEKAQDWPSNKRSKVWDEFVKIEQPDVRKKAKCSHWAKFLHCGNELRCDTKRHGTSQLKRHLKTCPKKKTKIALSDSPGCLENHELHEFRKNQLGYDLHNDQELSRHRDWAYNQQRNRELFVKMVIDHKTILLKHVENPFLKEFALSLQPLYSPIDQWTVEKDCVTFYENEKAKLKDKLSKLTSRVSFSLINHCAVRYLGNYCVAAHLIDNNFKLDKRIVGFMSSCDFKSIEVKNFVNDWTCDAYDSPIEKWRLEWDETLHGNMFTCVECILHCLKNIGYIFTKLYMDVFINIGNMLDKLMINHEQMSCFNQIASEYNLTPKAEFILYDESGLGSYFNRFHDAYTYKKVLLELGNTDIRWDVVEEVVGLLKPVNDIVVMLSSSECPTINLLVKLILKVKGIMSKVSPVLLSTKEAIYKSLLRLDEYLAGCDKMVHFASLLDPQLKLWFLQHCNGKGMPNETEILLQFQNLYIIYQNESREVSNNPKYSEQGLELKKYLESNIVDETNENFDVLGWWKSNELEFPILSRMARDILAIPITCSLTSGTEPVGEILSEFSFSGISIEMSRVLVCCNNWLRFQRDKENYDGVRVAQGNNFTNAPEKYRELLVNMVISSRTSFNLLKSSSFIEWARDLQPMYDPNVVSIERDLAGFYQTDRGMLPNFSDKDLARISFSVRFQDEHNFPRGYVYIYATVHYIDSDFNLLTTIIGMKEADHDHCRVAAQLERFIQNRGLDKNVLASTISKLGIDAEIFKKYFRIGKISLPCSIIGLFHILSSNYIDIFFCKEYAYIWEMITFLRENSDVMQTFNELALEYKIPRKSDFRLVDENNGWDSKFNMIHDALPYRDVFDALKRKRIFPRGVKTLSRERWNNLECHVKLWKPIYKAPIVLSSFKYPTSHLFLRIVFEIHDVISNYSTDRSMNSDHDEILDRLDNLLKFIDKYLKNCNKILLIASVLDPQFKFVYLERCYEKNIIKEEEVKIYMEELFNTCEIEVDRRVWEC